MNLSISRGDDLTPKQPSPEEQIALANRKLKEYAESLDREEIPMWLTNIIIRIFKGDGNIMDEMLFNFLKAVMDNTTVDEQIYAEAADFMKESIPGEKFEPVLGEVMQGIGAELQKKKEV